MTSQPNLTAAPRNPQRMRECTFHSKSLGRDMRYMVVLPEGYKSSSKRYPVLYLLHGWNGDHTNWCTLTSLDAYSRSYPFLIVTPDGQNSWYVNSATNAADRFYDYIVADLISHIDAEFRTLAGQRHRAIAGLSMGGYGSLLAALTHPEMFGVTGSISGAFEAPLGLESVLPDVRESIERAYGDRASKTRSDNDVFRLVAKAAPPLPYIFLQCGIQDSLLPANRRFAAALSAREIVYEYHELPGDHSWEFWDASLLPLLRVIAEHIVE